ncbi:37775_t:CDS:1, partial [Gigaspora margarita]
QYEYSLGSNYLSACKQCKSTSRNIGPSGLAWTYCQDCEENG